MLPVDPRRAALASLFIVERSGNLYALRVRDQATGGWALRPDERIECPVSMLEARMITLRDGLVDAALAALDAAEPTRAAECTGTTAKWCPVHGDCTCPETLPGERTFDDDRCPQHAPTSQHGERERAHLEAPEPGAVLAGIVRAEEHERAALVRERDEALREWALVRSTAVRLAADLDEARATIEVQGKKIDHLLGMLDTLKADLAARSPEGRKAAQLALFAPPAADPAGEAQRAAASGAAVGAIVVAAADAPAPEAKPRRTVTCGKCGIAGHNARGCHPEAT